MATTSSYLYPYDPTGSATNNLIVAENHTVQPPNNISDASFIIPRAAPFFGDSIIVRTGPTEASQRLEEGVDYYLTHNFVTLSYALSRQIYGSITLINRGYTGEIYATYQTVGGEYVLDSYSIIEERSRSLYNVYMVTWEQVSGNYPQLPPYDHKMAGDDLVGFGALVDSIQLLSAAIASGGGGGGSGGTGTGGDGGFASLLAHINANTAHTKAQVGLGNVDNYKTANEADVLALNTRAFMTPAMTKHYLDNTVFVSQLAVARQDITTLSDRVRAVEEKQNDTETNISDLNDTVTRMADNFDTVREDLDNLAIDVANAMEPFEGIPARIDALETKVTDALNRLGLVEILAQSNRDDLDQLVPIVSTMNDQILQLAIRGSGKVISRIYDSAEILLQPTIRVPMGRKAYINVIGSINRTATVEKGFIYTITDANGVIRPMTNIDSTTPLVSVNSIVETPVYGNDSVQTASHEMTWHVSAEADTYEVRIDNGDWVPLSTDAMPAGVSYTLVANDVGSKYTFTSTSTTQHTIGFRSTGTSHSSLYVNEALGTNELTQENASWVIYDDNDQVIDVTLTANQQNPPSFGDVVDNPDDYGVEFRRIEFVIGEPDTDDTIIGYTYTAGSVTARAGVIYEDKTKTTGRTPDPLTVNDGDTILRLDDITVNDVAYPISYNTTYSETTQVGVPSTGAAIVLIDNTAGTFDIHLALSGNLSLVTVTDVTLETDALINVTYPV